MSDHEIEIQSGFFASILYVFLKTVNLIQEYIGEAFWYLFVFPGLKLSKRMRAKKYIPRGRTEEDLENFVDLDLLKSTHKLLWAYLTRVFKINSKIHGIVTETDFFERLLVWNKRIPLLGYYEDKTTFTFHLLYEFSNQERTARRSDITWLLTYKYQGKFQIIHRETISSGQNEEVAVKCVWTSGKERGRTFLIKRLFWNPSDGGENNPSAIYYPPKFIVFMFELLIYASAVLAFFQFIKDGFNILKNLTTEFYKWVVNFIN